MIIMKSPWPDVVFQSIERATEYARRYSYEWDCATTVFHKNAKVAAFNAGKHIA